MKATGRSSEMSYTPPFFFGSSANPIGDDNWPYRGLSCQSHGSPSGNTDNQKPRRLHFEFRFSPPFLRFCPFEDQVKGFLYVG